MGGEIGIMCVALKGRQIQGYFAKVGEEGVGGGGGGGGGGANLGHK